MQVENQQLIGWASRRRFSYTGNCPEETAEKESVGRSEHRVEKGCIDNDEKQPWAAHPQERGAFLHVKPKKFGQDVVPIEWRNGDKIKKAEPDTD